MNRSCFGILDPDGRWERLIGCKRLPWGVRTFCPPGQAILRSIKHLLGGALAGKKTSLLGWDLEWL